MQASTVFAIFTAVHCADALQAAAKTKSDLPRKQYDSQTPLARYVDLVGNINRRRRCAGVDALCVSPDLVLSAAAHANEAARLDAPVLTTEAFSTRGVFDGNTIVRLAAAVPNGAKPAQIVDYLLADYYDKRALLSCGVALIGSAVQCAGPYSYLVVHLSPYRSDVPVFCAPESDNQCHIPVETD